MCLGLTCGSRDLEFKHSGETLQMSEIFFGGGPITPQKYFLAQIGFFPISLLPKLPQKVILVKKFQKKI